MRVKVFFLTHDRVKVSRGKDEDDKNC